MDTTDTDPLKYEKDGEIYHLVKPGDENMENGKNNRKSIVDDYQVNQVTNG